MLVSLFFLLALLSPSRSDPRIYEAGLLCGNATAGMTARKSGGTDPSYVPRFVKEMEVLSQRMATHHFATHFIDSTVVPIYVLSQCHRDLSQTDCLLCFAASRTKLPRCLPSLSARIFFDGCFLRYDTYRFFEESVDASRDSSNCSSGLGSVEGPDRPKFEESMSYAVGNVTEIAGSGRGGGFGAMEVRGVYTLGQCWSSLSSGECKVCLEKAGEEVRRCAPSREGRALNAGCYLRYSTVKFYNDGGKAEDSNNSENIYLRQISIGVDRSSLNFKYETLEKATNNFEASRKIGQGGTGSVYKGTLPNGQTVAVKRLVYNTRQWVDEFFNEVNLISGIHHKNLVKLLGCSIEGPESLLVYEYMVNKSLDHYIFDKNKIQTLNWKQRFNIIVGTAEGLAHLHCGCKVRIIHRDIKSSNVLLDENLNPKIADFGLARSFGPDMSHLSTGIAGTLGYMAPEYVVRGQLTEKVDVYSFGVLVLEIVCGRRNSSFIENSAGSLLQMMWRLYKLNSLCEAVDPSLEGNFPREEAADVLKIGLLCTQASAADRPVMARVLEMLLLTKGDSEVPEPNQPPFLSARAMGSASSTTSYSTNSLISNGATKMATFYTSSECSSTGSKSHG
ncbi:cysteine-rich receptor-like protein kinase 42 isoform X2 [Punica granatum]|uniref:Cysteine-rich receptor-like protein kinase 42 isoform X2 n=1 Tax=Punica granatum TaxID=22663 RepID=A0A6P8ECV9_PUNGR|nr:cysteine-rich receptor-like protein kinase 42 isoform X2 [Punica granatum]